MQIVFTNVPFKYNSASGIQQLLRFKRVNIVRLAYISLIIPNGSEIIQLLNFLKIEVLYSY